MSNLALHAGSIARERLLDEGLRPESFRVLVGASGGPKWFVLHGLDRYLFGEFFGAAANELITLGSSAGAWRMSCLATADPVAAIDRLATLYSEQRYSEKPNEKEVTQQARLMLRAALGENGAQEIIENERFRTHILAERCKGLGSSEVKWLRASWLAASASLNVISRRTLSWFFQRTVFTNMGDLSPYRNLVDVDTAIVPLSPDNLHDAMISSGSIPFVLEGTRDPAGARPGLYWDGGIVDYHFDLDFCSGDELVLYPHYLGSVIPGWFDKHISWRHARRSNYDNVVLLAPGQDFIASLPNGKLSDRGDFVRFGHEERLRLFRQVLDRSQVLAEEFDRLVHHGVSAEQIKPIGNLSS